jgi:hypothetical protein
MQESENRIVDNSNSNKIEITNKIDEKKKAEKPTFQKIKKTYKNKSKINKKQLSIEEQEYLGILRQPNENYNINNASSEINYDKKYIEDFATIKTPKTQIFPEVNPNGAINPLTPKKAVEEGYKLIEEGVFSTDFTNAKASELNLTQPNQSSQIIENKIKIGDTKEIFPETSDNVPGSSEKQPKKKTYIKSDKRWQ